MPFELSASIQRSQVHSTGLASFDGRPSLKHLVLTPLLRSLSNRQRIRLKDTTEAPLGEKHLSTKLRDALQTRMFI